MNIKMDHINITVSNLIESMAWYKNVFGFEFKEGNISHRTEPWAIIGKEDTFVCMYEYKDLKSAADADGAYHRMSHFGIRVSDELAWEEVVRAYKLKLYHGGKFQYPHSVSWYIVDPSGYKIEVSYAGDGPLRFG